VKRWQAVEKRFPLAGIQYAGQARQREVFFDSRELADTRAGVSPFSATCQARESSSAPQSRRFPLGAL
jgi:hypothetical protein